jgi:plasmid stabilization system protein ParE
MKVVWTEGAAEDLAAIVEHIARDSPDAARGVA